MENETIDDTVLFHQTPLPGRSGHETITRDETVVAVDSLRASYRASYPGSGKGAPLPEPGYEAIDSLCTKNLWLEFESTLLPSV